MKRRVVILGCGPSGLLAAHAARQCGAEVTIISVKQKSRIHGAQYLHRPIPGIYANMVYLEFKKLGEKSIYASKVYGDPKKPCSWDVFENGVRPAWSMRDAYNYLWGLWQDEIIASAVNSRYIDKLEQSGFDLLISTIPAQHLCHNPEHTFLYKNMWVTEGNGYDIPTVPDNVIIYSGSLNHSWYRYSKIFGHSYFEFGKNRQFGTKGVKPTGHDCDCRPNWIRMGRFGKWERGVLVHHAYEETCDALNAASRSNQLSVST